MRRFIALWALVPLAAVAQDAPETDPMAVAPQIAVVVQEHATGADLVTVTVLAQDYDPVLLEQQCNALGASLGSEARGLAVYWAATDSPDGGKMLKAKFATDGLIKRESQELDLQSIVRSFLSPSTKSFMVTFDGEKVTDKATLREHKDKHVIVAASVSQAPLGIDYRILVDTDDPGLVTIPSRVPSDDRPMKEKAQSGTLASPDPVVVGLGVVAAIAAGVLVYSLLASKAPKSPKK